MAKIRYNSKPKVAAVIFGIIVAYIICFLLVFASKKKVETYEVTKGSIYKTMSTSGLIMRSENIYDTKEAGNIRYYNMEASRVKVKDLVYTIDKTGKLDEVLNKYVREDQSLTKEDKAKLMRLLQTYQRNYDIKGFSSVYDVNLGMSSIYMTGVNDILSKNKEAIKADTESEDPYSAVEAGKVGYLTYSYDGLEGLTEDKLDKSLFDRKNYNRTSIAISGQVEVGKPAFRLVDNEIWHIYFPLTDSQIKENNLDSASTVYVKLSKVNNRILSNFSIIDKGGEKYGAISLSKYVIDYLSDRYLDLEITVAGAYGLKVPKSCVVLQDMYLIPEEYITTGGNSTSQGVLVSNGNSAQFKNINVVYIKDGYAYVKTSSIDDGTVILKPESNETMTVHETKKVEGVFNINAGYALFVPVTLLYSNEEYDIVKETSAGLSSYDRILLNAANFSEYDVVY